MEQHRREADQIGLCASCLHVRIVRSDRGSVFHQCQRAATDPRFPPYPNLPVVRCGGYELKLDEPSPIIPGQE